MSDSTDTAAEIDAIFRRDAALYEVIRKHGIRPVVFDISEYEAAMLTARFAGMFKLPALNAAAEDEKRKREAERHAALHRAIRQGSR